MIVASLPSQALADAIGQVPGTEFVLWEHTELPPRADEIGLLVVDYARARAELEVLDRMPHLRVVQLQSAGYDGLSELVPDHLLLANARRSAR